MKNKKILKGTVITFLIAAFLFNACSPVREFGKTPVYDGSNSFNYKLPAYDSLRKTVVIVANNEGTELFDMMAPWYLFNATGKANVYIAAKNKFPVAIKKGFFTLPQFTFSQIDSLRIVPDVIVIPFLSVGDSLHQDPVIVNWIKDHYSNSTKILAVCDGSATAAATGIFDGRPITAHASDFEGIKAQFRKPVWIQNTSVAHSGNLYSTAGVSNAVEGSLMVINDLFGGETMNKVLEDIGYPYPSLKTGHLSSALRFRDEITIAKKIFFKKNRKLGVLLQDGINEFDLAAVMDTYNRTFPKSIESFSRNNLPVKTKYGLEIIPSGKISNMHLDELHIVNPLLFSQSDRKVFASTEVIMYNNSRAEYIIDECLQRIRQDYGDKFERIVKLMLDYN